MYRAGVLVLQKKYLECGKVVSTHGVRGEIKLELWCDGIEFLSHFKCLYMEKGAKAMTVQSIRPQKNHALVKFEGVDSMDDAIPLRGKVLYIDRDDAPDTEGYYIQDLFGMDVVDADDGHLYGKLSDVSATGANDVYHITFPDGKERLIPAIPQVVIDIDLAQNRMQIRPLKGLFDDED